MKLEVRYITGARGYNGSGNMCNTGVIAEGKWHAIHDVGTESTELGLHETGSDM